MKRIAKQSELNSGFSYDKIYYERQKKVVHWHDLKRWKVLVSKFKGGNIVDMGALDSLVLPFAKKKYPACNAWGIDMAAEAMMEMRRRYPDIYWQSVDVNKTLFKDDSMDYIVAGELIEHLDQPKLFLQEAFRILKPDGILALSTPLEEANELGSHDRERHLWSFSKEDMHDMIEPFGKAFSIKVLGSKFFPKYIYHPDTMCVFAKKKWSTK